MQFLQSFQLLLQLHGRLQNTQPSKISKSIILKSPSNDLLLPLFSIKKPKTLNALQKKKVKITCIVLLNTLRTFLGLATTANNDWFEDGLLWTPLICADDGLFGWCSSLSDIDSTAGPTLFEQAFRVIYKASTECTSGTLYFDLYSTTLKFYIKSTHFNAATMDKIILKAAHMYMKLKGSDVTILAGFYSTLISSMEFTAPYRPSLVLWIEHALPILDADFETKFKVRVFLGGIVEHAPGMHILQFLLDLEHQLTNYSPESILKMPATNHDIDPTSLPIFNLIAARFIRSVQLKVEEIMNIKASQSDEISSPVLIQLMTDALLRIKSIWESVPDQGVKIASNLTSIHMLLSQCSFFQQSLGWDGVCMGYIESTLHVTLPERLTNAVDRVGSIAYNIASLSFRSGSNTIPLLFFKKSFEMVRRNFDVRKLETITNRCRALCKCLLSMRLYAVNLCLN